MAIEEAGPSSYSIPAEVNTSFVTEASQSAEVKILFIQYKKMYLLRKTSK